MIVKIDKDIQRLAPNVWQMIYGRRYILPGFRQNDYIGQDFLNDGLLSFLLSYGGGELGFKDAIMNSCFSNTCNAFAYQRPTYFLERELGEALLRGKLPSDLKVEDLKWKFPAFRVVLPKKLLQIDIPADQNRIGRVASTQSLMFIDVSKRDADEITVMPSPYDRELDTIIRTVSGHDPRLNQRSFSTLAIGSKKPEMITTGQLDYPNIDEFYSYALIKPFSDHTLATLLADQQGEFNERFPRTDDDKRLMAQMEYLALNVILFLAQEPQYYETQPSDILRKPGQDGKRKIPGLFKAKFVGESILRPLPSGKFPPTQPTGRTLQAHWRGAHWKRQPVGPGRKERKLIFVQTYHVGND